MSLINIHLNQRAFALVRRTVRDSADSSHAPARLIPGRAEHLLVSHRTAHPTAWRRWLVVAFALCVSVGGVATVYAATGAPAAPTAVSLQPFEAVGLPAGQATGVPTRLTLPAGTSLKHIHGGPTYVYVLSGSLNIIDSDGSTAAYTSGDFFPEAAGHVHTVQTSGGAEVFILQFLPPGAESLVPVE